MRSRLLLALATLSAALTTVPCLAQPPGIIHLLYPTPVAVSGVVLDSSGSPAQGVRIEHLAVQGQITIMEPSIETDVLGRFSFETIAPSIVFRKDGFESQLVRVPNRRTELRIVLKTAPRMDTIPIRQTGSDCVSVTTGVFCLPRVEGVQIGENGHGIDAFERSFTVVTASGVWHMIHGTGFSWGGPLPRSREVWSSIVYKERLRTGDGIQVIDASGKTSDGKLWRSVGVPGESVFYFDLDPDAAAILDRALDGMYLILN